MAIYTTPCRGFITSQAYVRKWLNFCFPYTAPGSCNSIARCDAWFLTFEAMATWRINDNGLIFFNGGFITKWQFAAILGCCWRQLAGFDQQITDFRKWMCLWRVYDLIWQHSTKLAEIWGIFGKVLQRMYWAQCDIYILRHTVSSILHSRTCVRTIVWHFSVT